MRLKTFHKLMADLAVEKALHKPGVGISGLSGLRQVWSTAFSDVPGLSGLRNVG